MAISETKGSRPQGLARYSTVGLLACEQRILDAAAGGRGAGVAVLEDRRVDAVLRDAGLNDDQQAAVRALVSSGNRVDTVQALAGTGKTTLLRVVADAYRQAGYQVAGVAPTARAARELRNAAGVPAETMHAVTAAADRHGGLAPGVVLLVDEAGMAPTRITARLFEHAQKAEAKLIAVGDAGQLTSVEAGGWFAALARDHKGEQLLQVMRQRDPAERAALAALHDGDPETYLAHKTKDITLHGTDTDALRSAVDRWARLRDGHGRDSAVMIVRDNASRAILNALAREHLRAAGELARTEFVFGSRRLAVGDRVLTLRNDRRLDVDNGGIATVTAVARDQGVVIRIADGSKKTLPGTYVAEHLEHAYAVTGHASQGATVEAAVVVGRPEDFTREWAYTALSRARRETHIELVTDAGATDTGRAGYAPTPTPREPADALSALARAMRRSEAEKLASEHRQPDRTPLPSQAVAPASPRRMRPWSAARNAPAQPPPSLDAPLPARNLEL